MKNNLLKIDDYAIWSLYEPRRRWRWNLAKCWPVRFVKNVFGFTAVERLRVDLTFLLESLNNLQKEVDSLLEKVDDLVIRVEATEEYDEISAARIER